jgi:hypothetical protein
MLFQGIYFHNCCSGAEILPLPYLFPPITHDRKRGSCWLTFFWDALILVSLLLGLEIQGLIFTEGRDRIWCSQGHIDKESEFQGKIGEEYSCFYSWQLSRWVLILLEV